MSRLSPAWSATRLSHCPRRAPAHRHSLSENRLSARSYSDGSPQKSPHAQWYAEIGPAMIPVFLLGSAVYLGLQLAQVHLSNEKYLSEASTKIRDLEADLEKLKSDRNQRLEVTQSSRNGDRKSWWWFS
ncbi:hypothetical protein BD410DRAFT_779625 [Rickenella mellea]|uniref:Uncharacterized protein n=1 Tax=Rickenella mellea TaxID=50990 RepID=A0A4R5XDX6_9AGAM|nr:hypothetical protein BD410DRAFT_779625 [Rickenella mellea]